MAATVEYIYIWGHTDPPSSPGQAGPKEFKAKVNPSNIKTKRSILFNTNNRANSGYDVKQYQGHGEIEMEIKLILTKFDAYSGRESTSVSEQIDNLLKATYDYDGSSHKSPYVTVLWGEFKFLGHLKDMSINYNTFNTDGTATNAEVDLVFVNFVPAIAQAHQQNRNSPDMTHMKLMKEGDKIPIICDDIYDDPTYYVQVAEANNLTNFRQVRPGQQIIFPPLVN
ncbi:CIS tube protein [Portibacter marinus]|uniref:CIS tube protein n=1 Tax=Portibacter marinus TaxID=2898660 RepID=UPI001F36FA3B|nr:hypothetical protein [Portibacter marinus]